MLHSPPPLWVLTCAPADRKDEAERVLRISSDPYRRVLVTTQPNPVVHATGHLLLVDSAEINISNWWTAGLNLIDELMYADGRTRNLAYDVLLIESDGMMSRADVDTVRKVMRQRGCVLAGPDWQGVTAGQHVVRRDNSIWINEVNGRADYSRLPGMALVVAGEVGLRHDPEFRWWLADDDFEWQARTRGGTVLVSGTTFAHEGTQGPLTGERLIAWQEDEEKFKIKWGGLPRDGGVA